MFIKYLKVLSALIVVLDLSTPSHAATYKLEVSGIINGIGYTDSSVFNDFSHFMGQSYTSTYILNDDHAVSPVVSDTYGRYEGTVTQASFKIGDLFASEFIGPANRGEMRVFDNDYDANGDGNNDDVLDITVGSYSTSPGNNFNTSKQPGNYEFALNLLFLINDSADLFSSKELDLSSIFFDSFSYLDSNFRFLSKTDDNIAFLSGNPTSITYRDVNDISAVPLPAAAWLFGPALLGIGYMGKRRKKT